MPNVTPVNSVVSGLPRVTKEVLLTCLYLPCLIQGASVLRRWSRADDHAK